MIKENFPSYIIDYGTEGSRTFSIQRNQEELLPTVDLKDYAEVVRQTLEVETVRDEDIDFQAIRQIEASKNEIMRQSRFAEFSRAFDRRIVLKKTKKSFKEGPSKQEYIWEYQAPIFKIIRESDGDYVADISLDGSGYCHDPEFQESYNKILEDMEKFAHYTWNEYEITRRRAILQHFIPNVFKLTKFNRWLDLIDGVIYYIEYYSQRDNLQEVILQHWADRNGIPVPSMASEQTLLGEDDEGGFYHPIRMIRGPITPKGPSEAVLKIVRLIREFADRQRLITPREFFILCSNLLTSKRLSVSQDKVKAWQRWTEKFNHNLPPYIQNSNILRDGALFPTIQIERGVFGVYSFYFKSVHPCYVIPRPIEGAENNFIPMASWTLFSDFESIDNIILLIPNAEPHQILTLLRRFPRDTMCLHRTFLRPPFQDPFKYFDGIDWDWKFPWDQMEADWKNLIRKNNDLEFTPLPLLDEEIDVGSETIIIASAIERFAGMISARKIQEHIRRRTSLDPPSTREIEEIQLKIEQKALSIRTVFIVHPDIRDNLILSLPIDNETDASWKYQILLKIASATSHAMISLLENISNGQKTLELFSYNTAFNTAMLRKRLLRLFNEFNINFSIYLTPLLIRSSHGNWIDLWDFNHCRWTWNPNSIAIIHH